MPPVIPLFNIMTEMLALAVHQSQEILGLSGNSLDHKVLYAGDAVFVLRESER